MFFYNLDKIGEVCTSFVSMVIYKSQFWFYHPVYLRPSIFRSPRFKKIRSIGFDLIFISGAAWILIAMISNFWFS